MDGNSFAAATASQPPAGQPGLAAGSIAGASEEVPLDRGLAARLGAALDAAAGQVRSLVERHPGSQPTYTQDGRWLIRDDPWAPSWSGGFLIGQMWVHTTRTGDLWWRQQAMDYCRLVEPRKADPSTHDIGFILEPSWGRWYDLEPSDHARSVLIEGGRTMADRMQLPGGYLSTWVDPGSTFIDVMMNVGIILRAARYSGDESLYDTALLHARTSRRHLQRGDGSTLHEGWFDLETGQFLRAATHQGYRADSSWARGQAWAIYGFTTVFEHTGETDVLDSARRAADYYISQSPSHGVPPNDWLEPDPPRTYEASAGAIASAGLLHLARADPDPALRARFRRYALTILDTLCSPEFLGAYTPGWEGVLRHASYHQKNGFGVDESVMWGDYYFTEALDLALDQSSIA